MFKEFKKGLSCVVLGPHVFPLCSNFKTGINLKLEMSETVNETSTTFDTDDSTV